MRGDRGRSSETIVCDQRHAPGSTAKEAVRKEEEPGGKNGFYRRGCGTRQCQKRAAGGHSETGSSGHVVPESIETGLGGNDAADGPARNPDNKGTRKGNGRRSPRIDHRRLQEKVGRGRQGRKVQQRRGQRRRGRTHLQSEGSSPGVGRQADSVLVVQAPRPQPLLSVRDLWRRVVPGEKELRDPFRGSQALVRNEIPGHTQHEAFSRGYQDRGRADPVEETEGPAPARPVRWHQRGRVRGLPRKRVVAVHVRRSGSAGSALEMIRSEMDEMACFFCGLFCCLD
mmetsp:Transcript_30187/g.64714  ORF Transcript_30187/g.64714 Transcript_30187/m.64714 type:complete len:284 (-) Transcript_30187:125-976(-)